MEKEFNKLFVGGDLSGIQKFIYNITSRKAAASLRGRSATLAEYMNDVCERLLQIPEIKSSPLTEKIYCSGGKFYFLTANTTSIQEKIDAQKVQIEKELLDLHKGQLALSIAYVPFCSDDNEEHVNTSHHQNEKFSLLFSEINAEFARLKNQKFKNTILDDYESFFEVQEVGGSPKVCSITGIEADDKTQLVPITDDEDKQIMVLPIVRDQVAIGNKLRSADKVRLTFNDYANNSYLGVLRMDVDGLGSCFRQIKTKAEYNAFSKKLDSFFGSTDQPNSKLREIWLNGYKNDMEIIYAGGDDIFVVGHWNRVISFAAEVQHKFAEYFEGDGVTLSGGITIVKGKFPIAKAADMAGEAEDKAKHYHDGEKNAFCMFGQVVSWNEEYDYVLNFKQQFVDLCTCNNMPRSILHRIMALYEIQLRGDMKYLWNTAYYLARFESGKSKEIKDFCDKLKIELLQNQNYRLIALAARWAEYELKDNNKLKS